MHIYAYRVYSASIALYICLYTSSRGYEHRIISKVKARPRGERPAVFTFDVTEDAAERSRRLFPARKTPNAALHALAAVAVVALSRQPRTISRVKIY